MPASAFAVMELNKTLRCSEKIPLIKNNDLATGGNQIRQVQTLRNKCYDFQKSSEYVSCKFLS